MERSKRKEFLFFLYCFWESSIIHCPLEYKIVTTQKGFEQENLRIIYTYFFELKSPSVHL